MPEKDEPADTEETPSRRKDDGSPPYSYLVEVTLKMADRLTSKSRRDKLIHWGLALSLVADITLSVLFIQNQHQLRGTESQQSAISRQLRSQDLSQCQVSNAARSKDAVFDKNQDGAIVSYDTLFLNDLVPPGTVIKNPKSRAEVAALRASLAGLQGKLNPLINDKDKLRNCQELYG